jgi:RimJ/RimL family protein N-acetyltransferase
LTPPRERAGALALRPWTSADRAAWLALFGDAAVVRWMGDGVVDPEQDAAVFERLMTLPLGPSERFAFVYAAELAGEVVGHVELKRTAHTREGEWELVYALARRAWGQGHGTALARWAFETAHAQAKRVIATVSPDNAASLRILESLGLVVAEKLDEGTLLLRERS